MGCPTRTTLPCRPKALYPAEWGRVYGDWKGGTVGATAAMKPVDLQRTTFMSQGVRSSTATRSRPLVKPTDGVISGNNHRCAPTRAALSG